jgi:hypothetical protein
MQEVVGSTPIPRRIYLCTHMGIRWEESIAYLHKYDNIYRHRYEQKDMASELISLSEPHSLFSNLINTHALPTHMEMLWCEFLPKSAGSDGYA